MTADGELDVTTRTAWGAELWSVVVAVHVAPGQSQVLTLEAEIDTTEDFAVVSGEMVLGSFRRDAFLEIVSVEGPRIYLPLVARSY